jgi:hypothetical protein
LCYTIKHPLPLELPQQVMLSWIALQPLCGNFQGVFGFGTQMRGFSIKVIFRW